MRISYWSSDVCSSDLVQQSGVLGAGVLHVTHQVAVGQEVPLRVIDTTERDRPGSDRLPESARGVRSEERRVGKSVSVRVDLGGRRSIEKKKNWELDEQIEITQEM